MNNWAIMSKPLREVVIAIACNADWRGVMGDRSARKNLTVAEALEVLR